MKILAGTCVRQHPDVLAAHLKTMLWQEVDADVDLFYILDMEGEEHETECRRLLEEAGATVEDAGPRPEGATYSADGPTHRWEQPTFVHIGALKDRILSAARAAGYDACFLVDSDLLLGPDTLALLVSDEKPVVSGVFWTQWTPGSDSLPNVWDTHPYGFGSAVEDGRVRLQMLREGHLLRVRGLGACTLIRRDALDANAAFNPPLGDLGFTGGMAEGEDRHFCVRATRSHIELWADAFCDIRHVYRPGHRAYIPEWLRELEHGAVGGTCGADDSIALVVERLDDPRLYGRKCYLRGTYSYVAKSLLAPLAAVVSDLLAGESRFVKCPCMPDWPIPEMVGKEMLFRLTLQAVRAA